MLHFHSLFSLFKSLFNFFATKYISVKVFAKDLSGLIFNGVFRIDRYDKSYPHLEKGLANPFRVARIYKNNFRQKLYTISESLYDFVRFNKLQSA